MAATNVQAFSGDVEIASNLTAASSKFSLDTNGTLKQIGAGLNNNYIKLMKYFASGSNWKIATGSYLGSSYQWLSIRVKMTRLDVDVKTIQFNYFGNSGTSRVRDSIVIGGGGSATQANEIKVYNNESTSTYEIYLQIDSATSVEVEITHRGSTIDDDYSTVATANNGAIDETGLTKIYDSGTTTDLRLKSGNVGIGKNNPTAPLSIAAVGTSSVIGSGDPSTNGIYLYNDTNAANEDATITMRVAGASAGDPKLSWDIAGSAGFTMGMDNSDSDKFKLCGNWYDLGQGQYMEIDRLGNTIFDVGNGGGTILSGLYNYTETQQMIDAGVSGAAGTIAASTDIVPPPGTAGDVIAKFVNTAGGEATTSTWYPGVVPIASGTVIYFGVWIYATQNIDMEFFRFHDTGSQNVAFNYRTPNKWVWFEPTITSNRSYNFSSFRFDNNSAGRTVYVTGLTIRVGQSQNTGLPFTPRSSPASNFGPVFTTHNLVAKEAAIKTLTGAVDVGAGLPGGGGLLITKDGYIQPGDINLAKVGINRALGGNYLFQGVYDAYRSGGQTGGTMTGIFQRYVQVIRMGSLVSIRGYLPSRQTGSTALNYRFTWAELGLDGQRSGYIVLLNYSGSTFGSWSSTVLGDSTYLTLQGTGMANNDVNVNYNNLMYLIDMGGINSY
jgi:hypothetical protein